MTRTALSQPRPALLRVLYLLVVLALLPFLIWNGFIQQVNAEWNDLLLRLRPPARSAALERITLVAIDDHTAARYGPLPLRRSTLAAGLATLAAFQPRVLALDLLIAEPAADPSHDAALASALNQFPAVVLAAALDSDNTAAPVWIAPLPGLAARHTTAHVHAAPDADGDVRSILLLKEGAARRLWAFSLEAVRHLNALDRPLESTAAVRLGQLSIPAPESRQRAMLINYAGPEGAFSRVSFSALLEGNAGPDLFRGRLVIAGVTAQGSGDRLFTPLSTGIGMSGIEIHANAARTLLDGAFLVPLGVSAEFLASLCLIALCVAAVRWLRGPRLFAVLAGLFVLIAAAGFICLRAGYVLPLASFSGVTLIAAAVAGAGEYALLSRVLAGETARRKEYAFRVQAIAHEIKTPLTAIQGSSEMIAADALPESQRAAMAGLIHKESKRLTGLIQTFLNVERLSAGALTLQREDVDLPALCHEVVERGRLYAARKRIRILAEVPPLRLPADPDLLSFAIYNLLTNAVKYSPKDSQVRLDVAPHAGGVSIAVADHGYGVAPAEQERIFEKFYRLKRDEGGAEDGAGIGLALVREIVHLHGGRISLDSAPGAGSRFTITLPAS